MLLALFALVDALWFPYAADVTQLIFHYSLMLRLAVALLVGSGLKLANVLFQQVFAQSTSGVVDAGVASGAQLGVTVATLWLLPRLRHTVQPATDSHTCCSSRSRAITLRCGAVACGAASADVVWGCR